MKSLRRNVLTIATGKKLYIDLAVNLARSFFLWHNNAEIKFHLVTDNKGFLPDDIKEKIEIIEIQPGELGEGFSPKLWLDKLAPDGQTLFVDSDCLIYDKLSSVFQKFHGKTVSVVGNYISEGDWFGNIKSVCQKYNLSRIPKFNGGIYYLEKGATANQVYKTARELENRYDEIGFKRLRGRPNDEVIMALAMELHGQTPVKEDGTIMAEFVNFSTGIKSDILNGNIELYNNPKHKNYNPDWPLTKASPLIVHFLGFHNRVHPYVTEERILYYTLCKKYPFIVAKILANMLVGIPFQIKEMLKKVFRPAFRFFFGVRTIEKSERIID